MISRVIFGPCERATRQRRKTKFWTEEREEVGGQQGITKGHTTKEDWDTHPLPPLKGITGCHYHLASSIMDPRLRPRIRPKPSALSFNLSAACASLLHHLPAEIPTSSYPASSLRIVQQWASGQGSSGLASPSQVLNALSDLSLVEDLTVLIAVHFRPLILDLTARLIPAAGQTWQDFRIKQSFHALCRLLPAMPELCP